MFEVCLNLNVNLDKLPTTSVGHREYNLSELEFWMLAAVMRNHITWGDNGEQEPCLDIDVNLEVTLEVYTKPFSLLPLSAVEKPGNLLMQGLLDRLVPLLAEQLLKDYHSWVQQQQPRSSS
ncbi:hypothetical protein ACQ4PT_048760 [Festuca glaucescens]